MFNIAETQVNKLAESWSLFTLSPYILLAQISYDSYLGLIFPVWSRAPFRNQTWSFCSFGIDFWLSFLSKVQIRPCVMWSLTALIEYLGGSPQCRPLNLCPNLASLGGSWSQDSPSDVLSKERILLVQQAVST